MAASLYPILGPDRVLPPVVKDDEETWLTVRYGVDRKWDMPSEVTFRSGAASDVEALIDLMLISSWGGIRRAWERVKAPGETWRDRGRLEIGEVDGEIGYGRFVVAETGGRLAGMILLNLVGDTARIDPRESAPEDQGALALIQLAHHSLFIREVATAEWARGKGLGRELMGIAERLAVSNAVRRTTLIVNDANGGAEKLYRSLGYTVCGEAPSLGHPHFPDGSRLVLMEKAAPPAAA
jgi:ribosomal protein S18 acetylase RimI-like enzyme